MRESPPRLEEPNLEELSLALSRLYGEDFAADYIARLGSLTIPPLRSFFLFANAYIAGDYSLIEANRFLKTARRVLVRTGFC